MFENNAHWTSYKQYFPPTVAKKDYDVIINGNFFFDQPVNNDGQTYDNVRKIVRGQGDDHTTSCLLYYVYFQSYKKIAIYLSKPQALDVEPKVIWWINFTGNLDRVGNTTFFIIEEAKETIFRFFTRNFYSIVNLFYFNIILI